ncbi:serine/threonine-protein kinase [Actinoplanes sp. NBRC 103695]|uniref:WD40 repeat domain-containing serine/threonine protein kinase n=1 Tax=Actinoplanes sp. NBRC 103695 TaxID=3032202 RepID=UPI0024A0A597|nr:serine/threonine-protein kinase [Actinoplanes sp. NBRC 103695]GLY97757.1 hypothetical protein Acsp02_50110 [Actinoplanes sp. NBRC 103695]
MTVVAGRYRLLRELGRGGMGAVWHAHDDLLGRDVAIKEIRLPHGDDDPMVKRALREAQAAARLKHPGIITVHNVVTEAGRPWIIMELVPGRSLADTIREHGLLTERRTAEIGLQVLDALHAAHRGGITHRDVKPANILLDDQHVVLTDFGIAAIDDATALTRSGQMVGSPAYMAPERFGGRPATAAADLWSLGVTLYAAVTGQSPFQRDFAPATMAAILTSKPAPPAHAGRLWPVIKGLLDKDPERRLTVEQARPLLAAVAAGTPAVPAPAPRRRRLWLAAATAGVVVAVLTVVALNDAPPPPRHPSSAPPPPPPAVVYRGELAGHRDTVLALAFSPDGKLLASGAGDSSLRIWDTATGRKLTVRGDHRDTVLDLAFNPDGTILASAGHSDDRTVRFWQPDGDPVATLDPGVGSVQAIAYSPDGATLAAGGLSGRIALIDTSTHTVRKRFVAHTSGTYDLAYSPDGRSLVSSGNDGKVRVWNAATAARVTELDGPSSALAAAFSRDGRLLAVGGTDGEVRIWETATWRRAVSPAPSDGQIETLDFSPDGAWLIAGTEAEQGVPVWQVATGKLVREVPVGEDWPMIARFSPDGATVATGSDDHLVRLAAATGFTGR